MFLKESKLVAAPKIFGEHNTVHNRYQTKQKDSIILGKQKLKKQSGPDFTIKSVKKSVCREVVANYTVQNLVKHKSIKKKHQSNMQIGDTKSFRSDTKTQKFLSDKVRKDEV